MADAMGNDMMQRMLACYLPDSEPLIGAFLRTARAYDLQTARGIARALRHQPFFSHSEWADRIPLWRGFVRDAGAAHGLPLEDALGLFADSGEGPFLVITGPLRTEVSTSPREQRVWLPLSRHLGAALRLRERLGLLTLTESNPYRSAQAEAIHDSNGKLLDARGVATGRAARDALRAAVGGMEQARRQRGIEHPEQALSLWQDLVVGRWSLLERLDTDGRRLLVAYRNDVGVPDPRALRPRELRAVQLIAKGYSNKQIAAEFGVSESAVSQRLHRAAQKLGVGSLGELGALVCSVEQSRADAYEVSLGDPAGPSSAEAHAGCAVPSADDPLQVLSSPLTTCSNKLSETEQQVVNLILQGVPRAEVARRRNVALPTIHNQLASAYRKLGVRSSRELLSSRACE